MGERQLIGERDFTPDAASVARARRFVLSVLDLDHDTADAVELAVSELATNAVLHARSAFRVRVFRNSSSVRVAVYDRSEAGAVPKHFGYDALTGRGLTIVERLSDDWGVTPEAGGKWVWFEMSPAKKVVG